MRKNLSSTGEKQRKHSLKFSNFYELKKRKKGFYYYKPFKKDMTYILGARCKDGVVLVGDTKVTIGGGTDYTYGKKIISRLNNIVMGSAGASGLYKNFQDRMIDVLIKMERDEADRVQMQQTRKYPIIISEEEFFTLVSKVIREMHFDYQEDRYIIINHLMIICATRIGNPKAQITTFTGYGFPEPVNDYAVIGHGEPYGALFLKKLWKRNMTMDQTAKLGIFIIKFIQDMKLDSSVGFNEDFLPQVVFIPDVQLPSNFPVKSMFEIDDDELIKLQQEYSKYESKAPIRELSNEVVKDMINQVSSKISDFNHYLTSGEFKL